MMIQACNRSIGGSHSSSRTRGVHTVHDPYCEPFSHSSLLPGGSTSLEVNPDAGLFFFVSSYRHVPLAQQYIRITEPNFQVRNELMNEICYTKVADPIKQGHQVMVFVHSRKNTEKTADKLLKGQNILLVARQEDVDRISKLPRDIGVQTMRLTTYNLTKFIGLKGYGLTVVERFSVMSPITDENRSLEEQRKPNPIYLTWLG